MSLSRIEVMTNEEKVKIFLEKQKTLINKGREKQQQPGKLTPRERIELLLDTQSFVELDAFVTSGTEKSFPGDGVVTGYGAINGRTVYVYSQDFSVHGGSVGPLHASKISNILRLAIATGSPVIGLNDSGGARIQEGLGGLDGYASIFKLNTEASGVIPQISVILGPCAGGAVYSPALTDFIFMVKGISKMFITGPGVIKKTLGQEVSAEELGGSEIHARISGVAHFEARDEKECLLMVRRLLHYLPSNNLETPPRLRFEDAPARLNENILKILPDDSKRGYDIKEIIAEVMDTKSFLEIQKDFAKNVVVGFAGLNNHAVGIVATQPSVMAGCLDSHASLKIARFVGFCDSFNIPLINIVDVPGYLPGIQEEHQGIIKQGAKILYAYAQATVPKISLIVRKAYGGAYVALCSKELGYDAVLAWPTAEIAVMGPQQAVEIIFRKELKNSPHPQELAEEKVHEYHADFVHPYRAAEEGRIDRIIDPAQTRKVLIQSLESLLRKREKRIPKKHGNLPL